MSNLRDKRLARELLHVQEEDHPLWDLEPKDDDLSYWTGWVKGAAGHMYEGGKWEIEMRFPPDYPHNPPTLRFTSDFYHPNVWNSSKVGLVCMQMINSHWLPGNNIIRLMDELIRLMNCVEDEGTPANVDASRMWRNSRPAATDGPMQTAEKLELEQTFRCIVEGTFPNHN